MSLTKKLIWLGEEPLPPAEPRFLSYFQWRYKRFRPFTLPVRRLNMTSMAKAETVEAMRQLVNSIPPYPRRVMAQYGVALLPVHDLWDDTHYMLGWGGGRGHDRKDGYDYIGGICVSDGHLAVVAETVRVRDRGWTAQENVAGIAWHELGHSFDRALATWLGLDVEVFSLTPEFHQAWLEDTSVFVGSYRSQFSYYLQPDGAGESEAFAECFAVTQGKGGLASNSKYFPEHFPRCLAIVRALVDKACVDKD